MSNVLNIARKEFGDFLRSRFILIITFIFLVTFLVSFHPVSQPILLSSLQDALCDILLTFGGAIALLMGYLAISNERRNNALSTMITKPLFRDTIINGKLLGAVAFLIFFFMFISAVYTLVMILSIGYAVNAILYAYLASIPLIIILSILCVMVYYSYSLLVSIYIKNETLALFVSVLIWLILTMEISTWDVAMYIAVFFGQSSFLPLLSAITKLCPKNLIASSILFYNDNYNAGLWNSVLANSNDVFVLIVYMIILVVASYIAFLRSDIS